jgi:hypothetical protein
MSWDMDGADPAVRSISMRDRYRNFERLPFTGSLSRMQ